MIKRPILGLDPGTNTGWAVCDGGRIIRSGVWSFAQDRDMRFGTMFRKFRLHLDAVQKAYGPLCTVAYELPFRRGAIPTRILMGLIAHVQERVACWKCKELPVNNKTLKKFATGNGDAQKPEMIHRAMIATMGSGGSQKFREVVGDENYRLGSVFTLTKKMLAQLLMSEHEADAIHVALWAWEHVSATKG